MQYRQYHFTNIASTLPIHSTTSTFASTNYYTIAYYFMQYHSLSTPLHLPYTIPCNSLVLHTVQYYCRSLLIVPFLFRLSFSIYYLFLLLLLLRIHLPCEFYFLRILLDVRITTKYLVLMRHRFKVKSILLHPLLHPISSLSVLSLHLILALSLANPLPPHSLFRLLYYITTKLVYYNLTLPPLTFTS